LSTNKYTFSKKKICTEKIFFSINAPPVKNNAGLFTLSSPAGALTIIIMDSAKQPVAVCTRTIDRGTIVKIHIKIVELEKEFIANCPELDVNCYGASRSEAVRRLVSVLQFYVDSAQELGLDVDRLDTVLVDGEKCTSPISQELMHQCTGSIH
jgi:predicted RNase H-like HicB family nuclease